MPNRTVLHLTGMRSTKYGALERYLLELARLCDKKGYYTVIQYESPPQSTEYLLGLREVSTKVSVLKTDSNLTRSILKVAALIYSVRPEIVQTHFIRNKLRYVVPIISRIFGVRKTIAMLHSDTTMKKSPRVWLAFRNYDHVVAVSNTVSDKLSQAGIDPKILSTHYLGLFGSRERSAKLRRQFRDEFGISEEAVVLACIAWDNPVKGLDILLDAFKILLQNRTPIHLIVVGVDPDRSTLPEQAATLGVSKWVHWAGIRDQGWQILNAADVYVQPSRSEGLGLAIIEAMSLSLPIVATRVGGIPEAVVDGETGYLAEYANALSLATAIENMLLQPSKWKSMGEAGYLRHMDLFRGENSIKALVENYFEL